MKSKSRNDAKGMILLIALFALAGCGGSGYGGSDLSTSNGGGGSSITNSFGSPAEMSTGDIMVAQVDSSSTEVVSFSDVPSGANFILALGSFNTSGSSSSIKLSTDVALPEGDPLTKGVAVMGESGSADDGFGPQEVLSAWLRASESVLPSGSAAGISADEAAGGHFKAMASKSVAPQSAIFRVLSSLTSTTSYVEVTGDIRCSGDNVVFYVDDTVTADILSDADIQSLCDEFDSVAGREQDILGKISDVDGDGKLHILMTKQINRLGALGGGIVTGYFNPGDLHDRNTSPASNYQEIIYTMVPDPTGRFGTAISKDFAMNNLLPAVLPHELQHAISYNQHKFVNGGEAEDNWLNEGMSHLMEDVMGYGMENPSRYSMYLASPSTYGIVTQSSPNLMERGGEYLFLRFLYEQAADGKAFLRALENTSLTGVANLEAAFNGPEGMKTFADFMVRFSSALAMTDRGITQDARYVFKERAKNDMTNNWEGVCLSCDADDGRGTVLDGVHLNQYYGYHNPTIDPSAVTFYNVTTLPQEMKISATQGGGDFAVLMRTK